MHLPLILVNFWLVEYKVDDRLFHGKQVVVFDFLVNLFDLLLVSKQLSWDHCHDSFEPLLIDACHITSINTIMNVVIIPETIVEDPLQSFIIVQTMHEVFTIQNLMPNIF